jgi:hypothetical protein
MDTIVMNQPSILYLSGWPVFSPTIWQWAKLYLYEIILESPGTFMPLILFFISPLTWTIIQFPD